MTDTAEADLAEIWAYLALEASEDTATHLIGKFSSDYDRLLDFPWSGPARPSLASDLRVLIHGNYASYYRVFSSEVVIIRVLHGARDVAAISENGGFGGTA